jgi:hypothetical protein
MSKLILRGLMMPFVGLASLAINLAVWLLKAFIIISGLSVICALATWIWIAKNPAMLQMALAGVLGTLIGCALLRPAQFYLRNWLWVPKPQIRVCMPLPWWWWWVRP